MLFLALSVPVNSLFLTTEPVLTEVSFQQAQSFSVDSLIAKPMDRIPSVSQLSDVRSSDWAFRSLQSLMQRYPILTGYPIEHFGETKAGLAMNLPQH
ncbi:hypothetical protein HC931_14835 [Candidatus Gracilibacteria bacterium]|nr:hypothetical protein [Candidatus Gracilibacteria bacterium]